MDHAMQNCMKNGVKNGVRYCMHFCMWPPVPLERLWIFFLSRKADVFTCITFWIGVPNVYRKCRALKTDRKIFFRWKYGKRHHMLLAKTRILIRLIHPTEWIQFRISNYFFILHYVSGCSDVESPKVSLWFKQKQHWKILTLGRSQRFRSVRGHLASFTINYALEEANHAWTQRYRAVTQYWPLVAHSFIRYFKNHNILGAGYER